MLANLSCRINQTSPIPLNADFQCAAGELLAIVGPSGGGKTTLLRMIAGLSKPAQGLIQCGEQVWVDQTNCLSPQARHIGYVPQHYGLFPHLTALENVISALDHLPKAQRKAQALDWLERVNLHGFPERKPAQLSGGQKQRVALARALAREPSVLLLDEPFSAVDRETRERLYLELAKLKTQLSIPIIMVTHDLNEALLLADKMLLLSQGRMLQYGTPREIHTQPRNEVVARQMGLRNIFAATVVGQENAGREKGITWLQMAGVQLACDYHQPLAKGTRVHWVIPNQGIRFSSIASGRLCRSFNKVQVEITQVLTMGEQVKIQCQLPNVEGVLHTELPLDFAQKLKLTIGMKTEVALRSEQIYLLPDAMLPPAAPSTVPPAIAPK